MRRKSMQQVAPTGFGIVWFVVFRDGRKRVNVPVQRMFKVQQSQRSCFSLHSFFGPIHSVSDLRN